MKYCKAYRDYEQNHGKPYYSPCERNKLTRVTLKHLRRLGLLLGDANRKRVDCKMRIVRILRRISDEAENVSGRPGRIKKPGLLLRTIARCGHFLGSRHKRGARTPNEKGQRREPAADDVRFVFERIACLRFAGPGGSVSLTFHAYLPNSVTAR